DRVDLPVVGVERHDRRLVQDDAPAPSEDAGIRRAKVDRDVAGKGRKEIHWSPLGGDEGGRAGPYARPTAMVTWRMYPRPRQQSFPFGCGMGSHNSGQVRAVLSARTQPLYIARSRVSTRMTTVYVRLLPSASAKLGARG